ncbi:MAG: hypothetical protein ACR2F2_09965 [Pyrinomonadaceae bacterium]
MEWIYWILIIFFVLSLISTVITAYRYRQYLQTGWVMLKMNRQFKQQAKHKTIEDNSVADNSLLIRCNMCQKQIPQEQAKKLKNDYFCSHNCLEKSFAVKT